MIKTSPMSSIAFRLMLALTLIAFLTFGLVGAALWFSQEKSDSGKAVGLVVKQLIELKTEKLAAGLVAISDNQLLAAHSKASIDSLDAAAYAQLARRLQMTASLEGAEIVGLFDPKSNIPFLWAKEGKVAQRVFPKFESSRAVNPLAFSKSGLVKAAGLFIIDGKSYGVSMRSVLSAEPGEKFILMAARRLELTLGDSAEMRSLPAFIVSFKQGAEPAKVVAQSPGLSSEVVVQALAELKNADTKSQSDWQQAVIFSEPTFQLTLQSGGEHPLMQILGAAVYQVLGALSIVLILCGAIGWWWGRRIAKPINSIQSGIKRVTEGDYKPIAGVSSTREISLLAESFNLMAEGMKQREKGMLSVAYRDPLTQLPNRSLFGTRLQEAISRYRQGSKGITTLLIDIDNFSLINDSFGQSAGDEILKETANRFKQVLRNADSLLRVEAVNTKDGTLTIARMGSSDFCLLLQNCDAEQARKVALRLRDALEQPFAYRGQAVEALVRIGIASFPEHAADAVGLMSCADAALAKAKYAGGSIHVYDPEAEKQREQQLSLLIDLKRSLERDELLLVFQPRISLSQKAPLMVEALLRWEHPERGLINPNEFVPFAEKTGFITLMTRWVIDQSLKHVNIWQKEGISVEVSVNVSMRDLSDKEFPTYVVSKLRAHKIAPQRLTLEVPDKVLATGFERILPQLTILTGIGVKIAIDDFGGGFSSLHYLKEVKATSAKIDRTFVNSLGKDKSRTILVSSVIALCHSMKMTVVAQGVEDRETMGLLNRLKCDFAQGYHFGKPLKSAEYRRWVQHQSEKFQVTERVGLSEV
jgi:diguanylate cyclase (GGDEF)-like protein